MTKFVEGPDNDKEKRQFFHFFLVITVTKIFQEYLFSSKYGLSKMFEGVLLVFNVIK